MADHIITKEFLHEILDYKDGRLFWKKVINPKSRAKIGEEAGHLTTTGYRRIVINYKQYFGHQLVFMMHYGYIPQEIDHINRVRNDNRIENLRAISRRDNLLNAKLSKRNSTGHKHIHVSGTGYKITVPINGKPVYLGYFKTIEDAKTALGKAQEK
jgi:hypothetical protein